MLQGLFVVDQEVGENAGDHVWLCTEKRRKGGTTTIQVRSDRQMRRMKAEAAENTVKDGVDGWWMEE